jgi:hypothetical protein
MARPLGSGPIHVYLGFGPPTTRLYAPPAVTAVGALYYGTTRQGPDVDEQIDYYQVMNDITGPKQSMDEGVAGREDSIALVMSSWTQAVDNMLEHFLDPLNVVNPRGTDSLSDLGTLVLSEGRTIGLWLVKAAGTKAINVAAGMPLGRYYPTTIMVGPNKPVEGNKENLRVRIFRAKKDLANLNLGTLPLFREDNAAFVGLPPATFG